MPNPQHEGKFLDQVWKNRLARFTQSAQVITWNEIASCEEIGQLVTVLSAENVPVRFNRSKDGTTCILTLIVGGEAANVYLTTRDQWQAVFTDLTK